MKKFITLVCCFIFLTAALGQDLYDKNNITVIEITFQESNWDEILDGYFAAGLNQRLMASVDINGLPFDSVGIRYRGGGSFDPNLAKNPFNIKLDYLKLQSYNGYETLKLNNGDNDPSFLREVLSYEIANTYMQAPRANFAKVFINGNFHGIYVNVETVDKNFMSAHFHSNKQNPFFNCNPADPENPPNNPPFGCFVGNNAALEYLGSSPVCYLDYYEIESDMGWNDLISAVEVIDNAPSVVDLVLNIDRAIWMCAYNNFLVNLDSYLGALTKNYYLFQDDNGRFNPLIWDLNESFGGFQRLEIAGNSLSLNEMQNLDPFLRMGDETRPMLHLIFNDPTYRRQYFAHYRTMVEEIGVDGWLAARAPALNNLISSDITNDPNKIYTVNDFNSNLNSTVQITSNGDMIDVPGIFELMNARLDYLANHSEFMKTPPTISDINSSPSILSPGTEVTVTASVSGGEDYVYLGHRQSLEKVFERTQMFDDGNHGDGAAGDGIYGGKFTVGSGEAQYYIYAENSASDVGVFSPARAEHEFYTLSTFTDLVINEFQASNATTVTDQNGQYEDWIELHNNTATPINLQGYYLTDDPLVPTKYQFPNVSIQGNGYLIIWADNDPNQQGLHAPYKLSANGESIVLLNQSLVVLDQITFGPQITDRTTGRFPNGTGSFVDMPPTFNGQNTIETNTYELAVELGIKMYPSPARENLVIEIEQDENFEINIFNAFGQKMKTVNVLRQAQVDVSDWSNGVYFLSFENKILGKVVIAR